jgi:hypothetical protein
MQDDIRKGKCFRPYQYSCLLVVWLLETVPYFMREIYFVTQQTETI